MSTNAFRGFPPDAFAFYAQLSTDNSKSFWETNKSRYVASVKEPFAALSAEVEAEFGPLRLFRPHRDVRFSKDKSPYKTNAGAVTEGPDGQIFYVAIDADAVMAGSGFYAMGGDQLTKYRASVDDEKTGEPLAALVRALTNDGFELISIDALKTAPRGFAKDHPRVDLLRRKGLAVSKSWPLTKWAHTAAARKRIEDVWRAAEPLNAWLAAHVGPSTDNPFER